MKKTISHVCIPLDSTIADALRALETNNPSATGVPAGIALIVSSKKALLGIVTDSDVRYALTNGKTAATPIAEVMNEHAFTVRSSANANDILSAVSLETRRRGWDKHKLDKIVLVDDKNRPVDIVHRSDIEYAADVRTKRIGVVGLGFVGLTLGLTLADIGFSVAGYDTNAKVVSSLRRKKAPFFEQGLSDVLSEHGNKGFSVVSDYARERGCDAYFIAVGTPVDSRGRVDRSHLVAAAKFVGTYLKRGDIVILRSTVPIGATRADVIPALERASKLRAGDDFLVAFAPERTLAGKALEELRNLPQVIGGLNRASANAAADIFNTMTDVVHVVDSLEEAEAVKLVNNTYRDVMFGFANEISLIFRKWGLDTGNILHAANAGYVRGGVPRPSPGVGGYCLTKDPYIFIESAKKKGHTPKLFAHARQLHIDMLAAISSDITAFVKQKAGKKAKIAVLGFGFKGNPPTSDMRGSSTVDFVGLLRKAGYTNIHGFDPVVTHRDIEALGVKPSVSSSACIKGASAVIVMTNHLAFANMDILKALRATSDNTLFFDCWALFSKEKIQKLKNVTYRTL